MMTGITRVSKESIISDLNNLRVVTTTSELYAKAFGFTENEVFAAMDAQKIPVEEKEKGKFWYDGFTFGKIPDIYNPWSVTMYLEERVFDTHWANTSGNGLVGKLIREGDKEVKTEFEKLLNGESIETELDEQMICSQLSEDRKVFDKEDGENSLEDTAQNALRQIGEKQYAADLIQRGIPENRILKYGFAFEGEKCLILRD